MDGTPTLTEEETPVVHKQVAVPRAHAATLTKCYVLSVARKDIMRTIVLIGTSQGTEEGLSG